MWNDILIVWRPNRLFVIWHMHCFTQLILYREIQDFGCEHKHENRQLHLKLEEQGQPLVINCLDFFHRHSSLNKRKKTRHTKILVNQNCTCKKHKLSRIWCCVLQNQRFIQGDGPVVFPSIILAKFTNITRCLPDWEPSLWYIRSFREPCGFQAGKTNQCPGEQVH